jgi:hypothetical protein
VESLLFMLNSIAIVLLIVMSLRDDRRAPEDPHTSFFRMTASGAPVHLQAQPATAAETLTWADWSRADQSESVAAFENSQGRLR